MRNFLKNLHWTQALLIAIFFSFLLPASIVFAAVPAIPLLLKIGIYLIAFISGVGIGLFGFTFLHKFDRR